MMTRLKKLIDKINCKLVIYNLKKVELVIAETLKMQLSPARFEYRLVRQIFILKRRVRLPYRVQIIVKYIVQR